MRVWQQSSPMFDAYRIVWNFEGKIVGSVPLDPSLAHSALEARGLQPSKPQPIPVDPEPGAAPPSGGNNAPELLRIVTGFQVWNGKLVLRAGTIKAHLKDCARQLQVAGQVPSRGFWMLVGNMVNVIPYWIPLRKGSSFVTEADGWNEQFTHVLTPAGFRYAYKLSQFVVGASVEFGLLVLRNSRLGAEDLDRLFIYGGIHGYGGERSLGEGRYTHELEFLGTVSRAVRSLSELMERTGCGRAPEDV